MAVIPGEKVTTRGEVLKAIMESVRGMAPVQTQGAVDALLEHGEALVAGGIENPQLVLPLCRVVGLQTVESHHSGLGRAVPNHGAIGTHSRGILGGRPGNHFRVRTLLQRCQQFFGSGLLQRIDRGVLCRKIALQLRHRGLQRALLSREEITLLFHAINLQPANDGQHQCRSGGEPAAPRSGGRRPGTQLDHAPLGPRR